MARAISDTKVRLLIHIIENFGRSGEVFDKANLIDAWNRSARRIDRLNERFANGEDTEELESEFAHHVRKLQDIAWQWHGAVYVTRDPRGTVGFVMLPRADHPARGCIVWNGGRIARTTANNDVPIQAPDLIEVPFKDTLFLHLKR
jgi:hypothetical protein